MNQLIIEGIKDVLEIIKNDSEIVVDKILWHKKILKNPEFEEVERIANLKNIDMFEISKKDLKDLSKTVHSQGIFLVLKHEQTETIDEVLDKSKLVVFLNGVQDPGNFGSIIRSAFVLGFDAVLSDRTCVKLSNSKVLRAIKGYFTKIPVFEEILPNDEILDKLKNQGFEILVADFDEKAVDISNKKFTKNKVCVVFGSEGKGIAGFLENYEKICIPMKSKDQSLNVAVSAGIIMFEVIKKCR